MDWTETNNYLKGIVNNLSNLNDPVRVAAFDLDDTIIHKPRGKSHNNKWQFFKNKEIITSKIKELVDDNYIIVIFTNQSGMNNGKNFNKCKWRQAMNDLMNFMMSSVKKYYFAVYVAKSYDLYRKPNIGLWEQMKNDLAEEFNLKKVRISAKSFFCGDAAGRTAPSKYRKILYPKSLTGDFADTDRKFALNIGILFLTPEQFFEKDANEEEYELSGIDPVELMNEAIDNNNDNDNDNNNNNNNNEYEFEPRNKEMIIMVGPPGSGKSEFVKKFILPHKYVHINQDTCRIKTKCLSLTETALKKKKSIVIDNTNSNVLSRMDYTSLAKNHGYKHIRAIVMNTDIAIAKHLNNVRHVYSAGKQSKINKIVYNIFKNNYVKPIKTEYFDKIETIDFVFDSEKLEDPKWKRIFLRYSE